MTRKKKKIYIYKTQIYKLITLCLSGGATHCHKEQNAGIVAASTPRAARLRPYSWWKYLQTKLV